MTTDTDTQAATYLDVPLATVAPNPRNPRQDLGDLTELTASIVEQGVLEPLLVQQHPNPKGKVTYLLIAGHRRLAAAKAARVKTVPVVVGSALTDGVQLERMLVENLQRRDLTVLEEGDAYQALLELDYKQADIAKKVGRARKHVSARVRVASLPDQARQLVHDQELQLEDAERMAAFADDADAVARILAAVPMGRWSVSQQIDNERARLARQKQHADDLRRAKKHGLKVYPDLQSALAEAEIDEDDSYDMFGLQETVAEQYVEKVFKDKPARFDSTESEDRVHQEAGEKAAAFAEGHMTCPGHVEVDRGTALVGYCLEPDKYHPELTAATGVGGTSKQETNDDDEAAREQQEREQQERLQLRTDLDAAARTRRRFLGEVITAGPAEGIAKQVALEPFEHLFTKTSQLHVRGRQELIAQILLPDATDAALGTDLHLKVKKAVEKLTAAQLVLLRDIAGGGTNDTDLEQPAEWAWRQHSRTSAYRAHLADLYGYQWSPVERRLQGLDDATGDES